MATPIDLDDLSAIARSAEAEARRASRSKRNVAKAGRARHSAWIGYNGTGRRLAAGAFLPAPQIQTERLALTPLHPADAEALFAYRSLPEVNRYQGWRPSHVQDAADFIDRVRAADFDTPGAWFQFAIRQTASTTLAGDLGVHVVGDGRQVEIGVTIAPAFQRRGFAREALAAVIDCLFHRFHKHRIVASVDPRNGASIGLVRSLGMRQEAHFVQSVPCEGGWADDAVFAILATEWRRHRGDHREELLRVSNDFVQE